jgi:hypothetical protein
MIIRQDGLLGMANPKGLQVGRKAFAQVVVKYLGYLVGGTPHRLRQVVELKIGIEEKQLRCYYFVATTTTTTLTIDYLAGSAQEEQQLTRP